MKYHTRQIVNPLVSIKPTWVEVDGSAVKIAGFEDYKFFTYRTRWGTYYVVETSTGMSIGDDEPYREDAVRGATDKLRQAGVERFAQLIQRETKKLAVAASETK